MVKKIYVNLPVKEPTRSMEFFGSLGFTHEVECSFDDATCMQLGTNIFIMLIQRKTFESSIPGRKMADGKVSETVIAITVDKKADVDKMMEGAISNGGKEYREGYDHGWMYVRTFLDLDSHIWEVIYIDETKMR